MKFFLTLFALLLCFLCSNSLTTRLHRLSNSRSTSTALYIGRLDSIPVDISSVDSIVSSVSATSDLLVPDTSIIPLDGGFNLGTLLWGFSLYYGFFPDQRSPADWLLVFLGNATNSLDKEDSNNQWYQDFLDGYLYDVPPPLFFLQVGIFAGLGYIANSLWIQQFDGDIFWGWSTGLSLSLPVGLLALSKDRLLSRSEATSQVNMLLILFIYLLCDIVFELFLHYTE